MPLGINESICHRLICHFRVAARIVSYICRRCSIEASNASFLNLRRSLARVAISVISVVATPVTTAGNTLVNQTLDTATSYSWPLWRHDPLRASVGSLMSTSPRPPISGDIAHPDRRVARQPGERWWSRTRHLPAIKSPPCDCRRHAGFDPLETLAGSRQSTATPFTNRLLVTGSSTGIDLVGRVRGGAPTPAGPRFAQHVSGQQHRATSRFALIGARRATSAPGVTKSRGMLGVVNARSRSSASLQCPTVGVRSA